MFGVGNEEGEFNGGIRDSAVSGNLANADGAINFHLGAQFLDFVLFSGYFRLPPGERLTGNKNKNKKIKE